MVWQFGYIPDESLLALSATSALHCLVAMAANAPGSGFAKGRAEAMSRYGMGLIVVTVLVVAAAAAHSGLSSKMTVDSAKSAIPEFSDEERARIFDSVMRNLGCASHRNGGARSRRFFAGRCANAGSA
jgi:hypothetical protein